MPHALAALTAQHTSEVPAVHVQARKGVPMRTLVMLLSTVCLMNLACAEYPDRPIRLIVEYPPNGGTDVTARQIAPMLSERLGKQIVIDNRSEAGSTLGTNLVAKATPDGYTLLMSDMTFGIVPGLYPKLPTTLCAASRWSRKSPAFPWLSWFTLRWRRSRSRSWWRWRKPNRVRSTSARVA
jgi:hypothetical protein